MSQQQRGRGVYEVTLSGPSGLGLELAFRGSTAFVKTLLPLSDGGPSPAQLCQTIRVGDVVLAVDGTLLEDLEMEERVALLMTLRQRARTQVTLLLSSSSLSPPRLSATEQENGSTPPHIASRYSSPIKAEEERRKALGLLADLGLVMPANLPLLTQLEQADEEEEEEEGYGGRGAVTSRLLPWKWRAKADTPEQSRTGGRGRRRRKRWGEFEEGEASMGLVLDPQEMERQLEEIASDVLRLLRRRARAGECGCVSGFQGLKERVGRGIEVVKGPLESWSKGQESRPCSSHRVLDIRRIRSYGLTCHCIFSVACGRYYEDPRFSRLLRGDTLHLHGSSHRTMSHVSEPLSPLTPRHGNENLSPFTFHLPIHL
jgi:hypothetical protein